MSRTDERWCFAVCSQGAPRCSAPAGYDALAAGQSRGSWRARLWRPREVFTLLDKVGVPRHQEAADRRDQNIRIVSGIGRNTPSPSA